MNLTNISPEILNPPALYQQAFDFEAELNAAKTAMRDRVEASLSIGRSLRRAKTAGRFADFVNALGITSLTAATYILQANKADGVVTSKPLRNRPVPKYTLLDLREMLEAADSLEHAKQVIDDAIAGA